MLDLRYEDLLSETEPNLKRVCAFLGVGYSDSMLRYPDSTTYAAPDPSLVQQWRLKCPAREIGEIEAKAGAMMVRLGYPLSGYPPRLPGSGRRVVLSLQNKWARFRFAARRYGARLVLTEKVTRWLGLRPSHARVTERMDEITIKYLK